MRTKPDRLWLAISHLRPGHTRCVAAPTWFLARQRAAVEFQVDPDEISVRPQARA